MSTFSSIIKSIDMLSPLPGKIDFISQSASLTIQIARTSHGKLLKHNLSFKITPISIENDILISRIYRSTSFKVLDSHNYTSIVGSAEIPPKIEVDKETQGVAGGFRGYTVTITWNSI